MTIFVKTFTFTDISRAISVEEDLFSGYQRRTCLIFWLSACKMAYGWIISVEDDLLLGISVEDDFCLD